jgi:two-component system, NtrC family, response regulator HydG
MTELGHDHFFERILAVGAHPDDIELGCFGTLARYRALGSEVTCLVLTWGGIGGSDQTRRQEAEEAAAIIGAQLLGGGLRDTEVPEGHPTIGIVEDAVAKFRPTAVIVNSEADTHQDHRATALATISAARFVPALLFYHTPSSGRHFSPTLYVDITDHIEAKTRAVKVHASQGENVYMADRAVKGLAEFLGLQVYQSGRYFEGFEIHQLLL